MVIRVSLEIALKAPNKGRGPVLNMSEEITELQREILALILDDNRRAGAITRTLQQRHVECNQNEVVMALNDLEKRDLVERATEKAWAAKTKAQDYLD
jgi:DNA-binding MarR family transcriptional regulator